MEHKTTSNRPWLDKEESLVIAADCTDICRETVERIRRERGDDYARLVEQANLIVERKTGCEGNEHVESVKQSTAESP